MFDCYTLTHLLSQICSNWKDHHLVSETIVFCLKTLDYSTLGLVEGSSMPERTRFRCTVCPDSFSKTSGLWTRLPNQYCNIKLQSRRPLSGRPYSAPYSSPFRHQFQHTTSKYADTQKGSDSPPERTRVDLVNIDVKYTKLKMRETTLAHLWSIKEAGNEKSSCLRCCVAEGPALTTHRSAPLWHIWAASENKVAPKASAG